MTFFASHFLQTLNKMNEIAIKVKNKIFKKGWHPENSVEENEYFKLFNYLKNPHLKNWHSCKEYFA